MVLLLFNKLFVELFILELVKLLFKFNDFNLVNPFDDDNCYFPYNCVLFLLNDNLFIFTLILIILFFVIFLFDDIVNYILSIELINLPYKLYNISNTN